ncbi:MAG TPA: MlaD family protein [Myxococcales bacterium]|nr:MlaD family protein [Myxococcales bacterium]
MSAPVDRRQRVRSALFLLVGIAVVVAAVLVLGRSEHVFARHVTLHTEFDDVGGLIAGSEVRLAGVNVGTVRRIHFDPDPRVRRVDVDLSVGARYLDRIRTDSVARVTSKGLLGDMIVDITVGSDDHPELHGGDHLPSVEVAGLSQVVEGVQHAIGTVDRLASDVDDRVKVVLTPEVGADVGRTAHAAAEVMEGIAHGPGLAHDLLARRSLAEDAASAVHDLRDTASRIDGAMAEVDRLVRDARTGPGALHDVVYGGKLAADLDATAANLADATRALKDGPGALHGLVYGDDAKGLVADLGETARILRKLAQEADQGKGTVGGLLKDPTAYQDLTTLLGNLQRNTLLKALIRYEIARDGLQRPAEAPVPAPGVAAGP